MPAGTGLENNVFNRHILLRFVVRRIDAALKGKTFRAPSAAKGLGRGADSMPYPVCRVLDNEHRVDDCTGPYRRVTYSPFSYRDCTTDHEFEPPISQTNTNP